MNVPPVRPVGLVVVVGLLTLSGCSSAAPGAATATASASAELRVGLLEWTIATSAREVTAGLDHLTITNAGTTTHDLHVSGPGMHAHTALLPPGGTTTLTITTRRGTSLTLTCDVLGHEDAGMSTTLAVVG